MKNKRKNIKENNEEKTSYTMIYIFISLILVVLVTVVFLILDDKLYLTYKNPIATIQLEELGEIKVELEPTKAPNTVNHIIKLIEKEFYNDKVIYGRDAVSIHFGREDKGMPPTLKTSLIDESIEEGSALDFEYEIDGEFEKNNFKSNDLKHEKYVLSLVRADYTEIIPNLQHHSHNSGSPMFKILFKDAPGMNGNYAAFGKVIEGFEIIDELAERKLRANIEDEEDLADLNEFEEFVKIESITVDTFGKKFKDVKLHKKFSLDEFFLQMVDPKI